MNRYLFVSLVFLAAAPVLSADTGLDTAKIEQLTNLKGTMNAKEGVFKVSYPRSDLQVAVGGVKITPPMGLTAWAAFKKMGDKTMVMGDMVLTEDQVGPVMDVALNSGLEVTALHNHFAFEKPRVMFMHISGMDDTSSLATAVGNVFSTLKQTSGGKGTFPQADIDPAHTSLHPEPLNAILGTKGELANGVYKVTLGRTTKMHDETVGNAMGVNTWAAFAGDDHQAVVDGDFAMQESELQPVLKALRRAGINIIAIHQHMAGETPRILFLHYWGIGQAADLAKGLKAALDTQKK